MATATAKSKAARPKIPRNRNTAAKRTRGKLAPGAERHWARLFTLFGAALWRT
ncbi:MAG: hypothetical protein M3N91_08625 [Pseudomonadota bacterium]|nr:hypothetical protein [Pseudomonadota bacterium]